jgi:4-hydroxy-3-methylbut-2-enyl diphosphate reductase
VDRAIEIVNRALEVFGPPIYVRHEVVHNKFVVEDLRARARFSSKNWTRCRTTSS